MDRTRLLWTAGVLAALAGLPALAQSAPDASGAPAEVVSTAPARAAPQSATSAPNTTEAQIADWIRGAPPLGLSDDDAGGVVNVAPDRGVHGEAGAFVSNRGYGGYVAATMPVGKDAMLGVEIADTQYNGRFFRGNSRSLAASLAIGQHVQRPASCPAGVQIGDRYVEPLWASHMRGAPLADDPDGCFSPAAATAR